MSAGLPGRDDDPTSRGVPVPAPENGHVCDRGWLESGGMSGPRPYPVCKPHLVWVVDPRTGRGRWRLDESKVPALGRRSRNRRTA